MLSFHFDPLMILQIMLGTLFVFVVYKLSLITFKLITIEVEDETAALIMSFGKFIKSFEVPGLYYLPQKILPWVKVNMVSLKSDFRHYQNIHINDKRGTTVLVDLWVEFKIADPKKALFQVENWEQSLRSLMTHAATSILCTQEFYNILHHRNEFGQQVKDDISKETFRWGVEIELVFIRKVSLLPEVSRQLFNSIAAKLEKAKAQIEEQGRLNAALLEAKTNVQVSSLLAEAKGQYPKIIGEAYATLNQQPPILQAYQELYEYSRIKPHRTIAFRGFDQTGEILAKEAAMISLNQDTKDGKPLRNNLQTP